MRLKEEHRDTRMRSSVRAVELGSHYNALLIGLI